MAPRLRAAARMAEEAPQLSLQNSAAVGVLARMGFQGDIGDETFKGYIKGLRKLGVPFAPGTHRPGSWLALYSYENLMELAVALSLRAYNILPDSLVEHLIARREALSPLYVEAWHRAARATREHQTFTSRHGSARVPAGPYLDLQVVQHGRAFAMGGAPQLIDTAQALELYGASVATAFLPGPIRIGELARLMARALVDPKAIRTRSPLEAHAKWILELRASDPALSVDELAARITSDLRVKTSRRSLSRFLQRHGAQDATAKDDPPKSPRFD